MISMPEISIVGIVGMVSMASIISMRTIIWVILCGAVEADRRISNLILPLCLFMYSRRAVYEQDHRNKNRIR